MHTFALVADGANGIEAVNITRSTDIRTELAAAAADKAAGGTVERGFRLSPERSDPLTPFDPHNAPTPQVFTFNLGANVTALARGYAFDNIADKSGRPLRDNWSIGARPLDADVVARVRAVTVLEVPRSPDTRGDGLGCVVLDSDIASPPAGCD